MKLPVGTRIVFLKTLTADACGDHPELLYAEKGQGGEVVDHGCAEGHWVVADGWPNKFGAAYGTEFREETMPQQLDMFGESTECLVREYTSAIPLMEKNVTLIHFGTRFCKRKVQYYKSPESKRELARGLIGDDVLFAAWPGKYSTDIFIVPHEALQKAVREKFG
jgi:hypothetical protein